VTVSFQTMFGANSPTTSAVSADSNSAICALQEQKGVGQERLDYLSEEWLQDFLAALSRFPLPKKDLALGAPSQCGSYINLPLANAPGVVALVDSDDYPLVMGYRWLLHPDGYAVATDPRTFRFVRLHRLITMVGPSRQVDHANRDKLDNRKANLRPCTAAENTWNANRANQSTGVKGISRCSANVYRARIQANGQKHEAFFNDLQSALNWLQPLREALHGEFARH
jgi:hypothetical protein